MSEDYESFPVGAQLAISAWLCDYHCHTDRYGLPKLDPMPPLQTAYEAIRALHDAGYVIVADDTQRADTSEVTQ